MIESNLLNNNNTAEGRGEGKRRRKGGGTRGGEGRGRNRGRGEGEGETGGGGIEEGRTEGGERGDIKSRRCSSQNLNLTPNEANLGMV